VGVSLAEIINGDVDKTHALLSGKLIERSAPMKSKSMLLGWLLPAVITANAACPLPSVAQSPVVEPGAVQTLRRATDYLAGLKAFRADGDTVIEYVLPDGQKLQFGHRTSFMVQRPNKLRAKRVGDIVEQVFSYDGTSLSVDLPKEKYYATVAAPPTIDAMLDFAREKFNVIAPASDLVYADAFDRLTKGLTSAIVVGPTSVAGVSCDHLAFRNDEVDWQIWIERGKKPLVRKFVVTSKKMPQSPQFSVVLTKWDTAPAFADAAFSFVPPKDAMKIDFLPAATAGKN
jgi:hypothetical protein